MAPRPKTAAMMAPATVRSRPLFRASRFCPALARAEGFRRRAAGAGSAAAAGAAPAWAASRWRS